MTEALRTAGTVGAVGLALLLASCVRPATQLLAVVETDAAETAYTCVRIEAVPHPRRTPPRGGTLGAVVPAQLELPFSVGIVPPDGDARARIEIVAELRNDTCAERAPGEAPPRVRRTIRTGFLPEQSLRLPIFLGDRCLDVLCSAEETCDASTGSCTPIPDIDPLELEIAIRGSEIRDAGPPRMDAPLPDAPGLDAALMVRTDTGALPDAPLPDAGTVCPTLATNVGGRGSSVISDFGLAQSADGTRGVRSYVFANGAGGEDLTGGSLGGGVFAIGCRGPTGAALTDDGVRGAHVFVHPTRGFMVETYGRSGGTSSDTSLGGAGCATARCVAEHLGHFAVLRGTATLSLVEIASDSTQMGSATVASGTTQGAVRAAASALLVSYAQSGVCVLERREVIASATASVTVPDCTSLDMAELSDARVAVAWLDGAAQVQVGIADAGLSAVVPLLTLDASQGAPQPVEVNATASGFRVTWVDDLSVPLLRSVRFDAAGTPLTSECSAAEAHTLAEYRRFHTVRRGTSSAVEWVHGDSEFWSTTWSDL